MNWSKWWDDFGWLLAGLGIGIFVARIIFGRDAFCATAAEEHCVREWISASAGWAAVLAAVPTILYLSKQVEDASLFHRQNAAINLRRSRTLAQRVKRQARFLEENELFGELTWHDKMQMGEVSPDFIKGVIDEYRILESYIDRADFLRVEDEIAAPDRFSYEMLMRRIQNECKVLQEWHDGLTALSWENLVAWMTFIYQSSGEYARYLSSACDDYLSETAQFSM